LAAKKGEQAKLRLSECVCVGVRKRGTDRNNNDQANNKIEKRRRRKQRTKTTRRERPKRRISITIQCSVSLFFVLSVRLFFETHTHKSE
jgi:hypothetical protein